MASAAALAVKWTRTSPLRQRSRTRPPQRGRSPPPGYPRGRLPSLRTPSRRPLLQSFSRRRRSCRFSCTSSSERQPSPPPKPGLSGMWRWRSQRRTARHRMPLLRLLRLLHLLLVRYPLRTSLRQRRRPQRQPRDAIQMTMGRRSRWWWTSKGFRSAPSISTLRARAFAFSCAATPTWWRASCSSTRRSPSPCSGRVFRPSCPPPSSIPSAGFDPSTTPTRSTSSDSSSRAASRT